MFPAKILQKVIEMDHAKAVRDSGMMVPPGSKDASLRAGAIAM